MCSFLKLVDIPSASHMVIPDVLYSDYRKAPLSGSAISADTLPATGKDTVIPTGKLEIQTPKVYRITCQLNRSSAFSLRISKSSIC
jgi:hypothetical protein